MDSWLIVVIVVIAIAYFWYASIISKKNTAKEALSGIDVQLKKRSNLIPNILKIAQKFMEHEKELLTTVTELRSKVDAHYDESNANEVESHLRAVGQLDGAMGRIMVAVEAYPELKSDASMQQAQKTYNEVEEHIAAARRFYNSSVTQLNNSIEIFPGNLLAGLAKASPMPFYETDTQSRAPVNADDFLK